MDAPDHQVRESVVEFLLLHMLRRQLLSRRALAQRGVRWHQRLAGTAAGSELSSPRSWILALRRMERRGWLFTELAEPEAASVPEWVYALTPAGREQLAAPATPWAERLTRWLAEGRFDRLFGATARRK